jgi:hypothetical protein
VTNLRAVPLEPVVHDRNAVLTIYQVARAISVRSVERADLPTVYIGGTKAKGRVRDVPLLMDERVIDTFTRALPRTSRPFPSMQHTRTGLSQCGC